MTSAADELTPTAAHILAGLMESTSADPLPNLGMLFQRPTWQADAACRDADEPTRSFFPERGGSTKRALAICAVCPVRAECLAYALEDPTITGVWGGTTARQRAQIRRDAR